MNKKVTGKLAAYFKLRMGFFDYDSKKGWTLKGNCIFCGSENKCGINLGQLRTNCFKCEEKVTPIQLVMENENYKTRTEAYALLNTFEDLPFLDVPVHLVREDIVTRLPEEFRLIGIRNDETSKLVNSIMKSRGFSIDELMYRGVGYCVKGNYGGRIIMPFYYGGKLVYFNARKFVDIGTKFKNPSYEEFGIGKALLIYNIDALAIYNRVRIVESVTNSWTIGDSAISLGGKTISPYQLSAILRSPVKNFSIMLDPDAYLQALKMGMDLAQHRRVKVIKFPMGTDVNDLGKKETLRLEKETPYLGFKELYKLYLNEKNR